MLNVLTKFYKIERKQHEIMHTKYIQSIIDYNLRAHY